MASTRCGEGPPVEQPGERVGRGLQLRLGHDPEQADARARQLGQRGQVVDAIVFHLLSRLTRGVDHAHRAAHDGHRHAERREAALGAVAQLRAGVEMVAVGEDLGLGAARRRAAVRRVDAATRRLSVGTDGRHAVKVRMAVVGQQQLGRGLGQHGREGPLNDLNDLGLAFGHVECVGQATLETLSLHLGIADLGLAVGVGHGLAQLHVQPFGIGHGTAQFRVEVADLLVGAPLVALPQGHQHEGQREHDAHEDADRHQVGVDTRGERLAGDHAGDEDQGEGAEGDDGADQAEAG